MDPTDTSSGPRTTLWPDLSPALPADDIEQVMARLLAEAQPVTFRVAASHDEKESAYRLRYEAIMARGWARPQDLPEGIERDPYDERAVQIVGWHEGIAVTTGRIVFPEPGRLLPTEEAFDLVVEPRGSYADAGRGVVAPAYSEMSHRVLLGMMARCWYEIRAHGLNDSPIGVTSPVMIRLYQRMEFPVLVLGKSRHYWGEERFPILIDTPGVCRLLAKRWDSSSV